jgi:hypothetical protein
MRSLPAAWVAPAIESLQTEIPRAISMASVSRTKQFADVHKVLKRHYKPVKPDGQRPVLEHLLFACCLEDAHYEPADEAFAALVHTFFDWNEVRVTSIRELGEAMRGLPDPQAAANRLKRVLQSVFEESLRKKNLGPTIKWLRKGDGSTEFSVAYVVQSALGGHAIPVDSGTLAALRLLDLISDKDVEAHVVPGLERAVAKSKGIEFGSLLHQFGADFTANPYSPVLRETFLEINPDVADRLPKRRVAKAARKKSPAEQAGPGQAAPAGAAEHDEPTDGSKMAEAKAPDGSEGPVEARGKKPGATKKKPAHPPEASAAPATPPGTVSRRKKPASERISKRKPR